MLTVSVIDTDWLEVTVELEMTDKTDVACKLELISIEFMLCDSTLGDKVVGIEDMGADIDDCSACVDAGAMEEFSWVTDDNGVIRVALLPFCMVVVATAWPVELVSDEAAKELDNLSVFAVDDNICVVETTVTCGFTASTVVLGDANELVVMVLLITVYGDFFITELSWLLVLIAVVMDDTGMPISDILSVVLFLSKIPLPSIFFISSNNSVGRTTLLL